MIKTTIFVYLPNMNNFDFKQILIMETSQQDFENLLSLWNNREVMRFVGFPNGLNMTMDKMDSWFQWAISKPYKCHYSIYHPKIGFCGETFFNVDQVYGLAALDIKLLPIAWGKAIGSFSLRFAINQAFNEGKAKRVYVDPDPMNEKAWNLYKKLGFISKPRPLHLDPWDTYLEIQYDDWYDDKVIQFK